MGKGGTDGGTCQLAKSDGNVIVDSGTSVVSTGGGVRVRLRRSNERFYLALTASMPGASSVKAASESQSPMFK